MMSDAYWRTPAKWNRAAKEAGVPAKVFCASMADVFEQHPVPEVNAELDAARARLWSLIEQTPWLIWQLLTKRPENVAALAPWGQAWGQAWPDNVWLGTSVENQRWANERLPILAEIPAAVRFLSCEPLLGPTYLALTAWGERINWCIVGGESGHGARRMELDWARLIVEECQRAGTAAFVKQLGSAHGPHKGGDISTWPPELQVREYPQVVAA